jgi:hypothetical protein
MSCEQPVHSASQSEIRSQILRDANTQYNSHIRALDASTQDDSAINIQIVELMEQMLQNNIDNADLLEGQKERLQRIENSLTVNKNYLHSLRDSIELNEDSKLVISSRINSSKERTENVSKQFTVYLSIIVILFLGEMGVLFFV